MKNRLINSENIGFELQKWHENFAINLWLDMMKLMKIF